MDKALSTSNTIKATGIFFAGAVACMLGTWWTLAYVIWAMMGLWLLLYILYRKQVLEIDIWKCEVENLDRDRNEFDLIVHCSISSRHNEAIMDI
jgi:hypothetical protein